MSFTFNGLGRLCGMPWFFLGTMLNTLAEYLGVAAIVSGGWRSRYREMLLPGVLAIALCGCSPGNSTVAANSETPAAATPTMSPAQGTSFNNSLSVSVSDSTPGAIIYYTTNGSTPTTSSPVYSGPITLTATTTINAIATASG